MLLSAQIGKAVTADELLGGGGDNVSSRKAEANRSVERAMRKMKKLGQLQDTGKQYQG